MEKFGDVESERKEFSCSREDERSHAIIGFEILECVFQFRYHCLVEGIYFASRKGDTRHESLALDGNITHKQPPLLLCGTISRVFQGYANVFTTTLMIQLP
jgi:hypothetical protein